MITLGWLGNPNAQIAALMSRYRELPRHIAKKHLQAVMKRAMKDGVKPLRALTPKGKPRNTRAAVKRDAGGRFVAGSGKKMRVRGGALRRAVTTKAKYIGRNKDGVVYGTIGYRAGMESRKALWLEFGTTKIKPRKIMEKFTRQYGGPAAKAIVKEMRKALESAAREMASGKNPTRNYG
jgi:HK97 gp10 family phage protein